MIREFKYIWRILHAFRDFYESEEHHTVCEIFPEICGHYLTWVMIGCRRTDTQRTHKWHHNFIKMTFWRNNDIIALCVCWVLKISYRFAHTAWPPYTNINSLYTHLQIQNNGVCHLGSHFGTTILVPYHFHKSIVFFKFQAWPVDYTFMC